MYSWQLPEWPGIYWDEEPLERMLYEYDRAVTLLREKFSLLPAADRSRLMIKMAFEEAIATSAIEGEFFDQDELRMSVDYAMTSGLSGKAGSTYRIEGISQLVAMVKRTCLIPISEVEIKFWHYALLGHDDTLSIVADYRTSTNPMQIVSGPPEQRTIHFVAPPAVDVPNQMRQFVHWINQPGFARESWQRQGALRAGAAHLYFECIHPFEDGNGRIGRCISEKVLSRFIGQALPFSLSSVIWQRHQEYYQALNEAQQGLDITGWQVFFLEILNGAVQIGQHRVDLVMAQEAYFERFGEQLRDRHRKVLLSIWRNCCDELESRITTSKYTSITRASRATAARDLEYLIRIGALEQRGAGRSTYYVLPGTPE